MIPTSCSSTIGRGGFLSLSFPLGPRHAAQASSYLALAPLLGGSSRTVPEKSPLWQACSLASLVGGRATSSPSPSCTHQGRFCGLAPAEPGSKSPSCACQGGAVACPALVGLRSASAGASPSFERERLQQRQADRCERLRRAERLFRVVRLALLLRPRCPHGCAKPLRGTPLGPCGQVRGALSCRKHRGIGQQRAWTTSSHEKAMRKDALLDLKKIVTTFSAPLGRRGRQGDVGFPPS